MPTFTFTSINVPAAAGTYVYISAAGVDTAGEVVGNYGYTDGDGDNHFHGFTAEGSVGVTFDPLGSTNTDVVGITAGGEIYGNYIDEFNRQYGFVDIGGTVEQVAAFLASSTTVNGVNDAGTIFGEYVSELGNKIDGFIIEDGAFTTINDPTATTTSVSGVNAAGEIVGTITDASNQAHGFTDINGSFTTFDPAGSILTSVVGVSAGGEVVGNYENSSGVVNGFTYDNSVVNTIDISGAVSVGVAAVNDAGEIVGYWTDGVGNVHGFVDIGGVITKVDVPGATETDILGIDNSGNITGYYNDSSDLQHGFAGVVITPVVTVPNPMVNASSTAPIAVSALVSATDADNEPLAYIFYEYPSDGGHFVLNGTTTEPVGQIFGLAASQLSQLTYVPATNHSDSILVGASDADGFSGWSSLQINGPVPTPPVVTVPNPMVNASSTQPITMSTLVSATNANNEPMAYILYEGPSDGGHFVLNGTTTEPVGQIFGVSQLSQLTYVPATNHSDSILVGASDADGFSGWSSLQINGPVPTLPVVAVPNPMVNASSTQPIAVSTLVGATDTDNEPLAYIFYENPSDGGHFVLNGTTTEPIGQIFGLAASQLSQLAYVPATNHSDSILVGASDADGFSGWSSLQINGPVPTPPVVTVPNPTVNASSTQPITMSTLASATNANNEPMAYNLYENPSDGGHFVLNGTTTEPIGQIFGVSQLSQLTYVPVAGHADSLLVGASDADGFSGWSDLLINGPAAMAIAISTFGPDNGAGASGWQPPLAPGQSGPSDLLPGAAHGSEFGGEGPKPMASR